MISQALCASVIICCCQTKEHSKGIPLALALRCFVLQQSVGDIDVLIRDFQTVRQQATDLGLIINEAKYV